MDDSGLVIKHETKTTLKDPKRTAISTEFAGNQKLSRGTSCATRNRFFIWHYSLVAVPVPPEKMIFQGTNCATRNRYFIWHYPLVTIPTSTRKKKEKKSALLFISYSTLLSNCVLAYTKIT